MRGATRVQRGIPLLAGGSIASTARTLALVLGPARARAIRELNRPCDQKPIHWRDVRRDGGQPHLEACTREAARARQVDRKRTTQDIR